MSYFFAGYTDSEGEEAKLETIFSDFNITGQKHAIRSAQCFITDYEENKVIRDIIIRDKKSDSWIVLVGMPLINHQTDDYKQLLIENFLENYSKTIINEIDGHFGLLAYDSRKKQLVAATDFNNFVPIFYSMTINGVVFSSSELAIAKLLQKRIDPLGLTQAVVLGSTWGSRTRFDTIQQLRPCGLVIVDEKHNVRKEHYWKPGDEEPWPDKFDIVLEKWLSSLTDTVKMLYDGATVKDIVWTDFTGGEDARLLVAACHALELPYRALIRGLPGHSDVILASKAAKEAGFELIIDQGSPNQEVEIAKSARDVCLSTDGYGSFFHWLSKWVGHCSNASLASKYLHFSGVPGGEAFRGTYYRRAKILFPSISKSFDYRFFVKMKYLLDFIPGLFNNEELFLEECFEDIKLSLEGVNKFDAGIKVDHLLREFQTSRFGLSVKHPFYLPFGCKAMTRSIYSLPARFKNRGKLTRACTEILFARLAHIKTQNGVPTIRRTLIRTPLFWPEYLAEGKKILNGLNRRYFHLSQSNPTLSARHRMDLHGSNIKALFNSMPFSKWFDSKGFMITGDLYDGNSLDSLLRDAKNSKCPYVQVLGRIVNQELACRYVYGQM